MKETFATRSVNFDFQVPIFRLFSHKVVRNCYLIFILHTIFFCGDILELTQATLHCHFLAMNFKKSLQKAKLNRILNKNSIKMRNLEQDRSAFSKDAAKNN